MIYDFLLHQWLRLRRSSSFGRELGITILVAVMAVMITFLILGFALVLPKIIGQLAADRDPLQVINEGVIYYFLLDLVMRYLLQRVPALDIEPYLILPVKRSAIARFLLIRSMFSLFNVYPVVLVTPLAIQTIFPAYGWSGALAWSLSILCVSWSVHFLQLIFKKKYEENPVVWITILLIAVGNYLVNYFFGISLFAPAASAFYFIMSHPAWVILPATILIIMAVVTYRFLRTNMYIEDLVAYRQEEHEDYSSRLSFLRHRGLESNLLLQEIRLILRHKRTRSVILLSVLFIPYGLLFFGRETYSDSPGIYVFMGIFITALFTINYGQFFWGWNTNQLDFYFSRPFTLKAWVYSRYRLLVLSTFLSTLLSLPYAYFGWEILLVLLCCCLFNIGINIPIMMRLSLWEPKPIELNKSAFMNYQGTGPAQWVMAIPILALPYVFYLPVNYFFGFLPAVIAVGLAGFAGVMFRNFILDAIIRHVRKNKYKLIRDLII